MSSAITEQNQRRRYTQAHYESLAKRANNREMSEVPLLVHAGLVESHTPEEMREKQKRHDHSAAWHFLQLQRYREGQELLAMMLRDVVQEHCSTEQFATLEWFLAHVYPVSYACGYWTATVADINAQLAKVEEFWIYCLLHKFLDFVVLVKMFGVT